VARHPLLRPLYVVAVCVALAQALVLSSVVLFATRRLGLTPRGFGVFMAFTAVGNIVGGLVTPRLWRDRGRTRALLLGSLGLMGASYLVLASTRNTVLACATLVAEALAIGAIGTISPTLRLENAGGRAGGVATFFRQGAYTAHAVGGVVAGFLVTRLGFTTTYTIAGLGALAMLVFVPGIARQVAARTSDRSVPDHEPPEHDPLVTPFGLMSAAHSIEHDDADRTPIRWDPPLVSDRHGW
jgi:predicted MFS family arabinose efflux permease